MEHGYKWKLFIFILLLQTVSPYLMNPEHKFITSDDVCLENDGFCTLPRHGDSKNKSEEMKKYNLMMMTNDTKNAMEGTVPWYLRIPLLPVIFATSPTLPEGQCKIQTRKYMEELNRGTLWAVQMFDSSTKYPNGIMAGQTRSLGNFDECYQIFSKNTRNLSGMDGETIGGKYCLVKVKYQRLNTSNEHLGPASFDFDMDGSVWEAIKEKGDFRRLKRYSLELAICVPDACHASDIEKALEEPLREIGLEQQLIVQTEIKGNCQSKKEEAEFSFWARVYCYTICGLLLLVGVATWCDTEVSEEIGSKSLTADIILCFSAKRNYRSITEINDSHPGLDCLHLFRTFFTCCTVLGHRMLQYLANPVVNAETMEYTFTMPSMMIVYNGPIVIDYFFAMGGMLFGYYMLVELNKKKKINFPAAIFTRYIRYTPSYLMVILFIILILPHLGSGPYWDSKIVYDSKCCANNWWTNILYINNYVNTHELCMFQTWYVTMDFHLYIIALFVVYFFWKMPRRIGYPFLTAIILGGSLVPFYLSYFKNVAPIYRAFVNVYDVKHDWHFTHHYIKTHERMSTYFVGVLGGAFIYDHSLSPWNIPKLWKRFPFIPIAIVGTLKLVFMGLMFYDPFVIPTPIVTALYASLHKLIIALVAIAVIIQLSVIDELEIFHTLLQPRWVQPLGRLTYGVYLVHNIYQSYEIGNQRTARTYSASNAFRDFVLDISISFTIAFVLAMIIEGPFRKIEKRLIGRRSTKLISAAEEDARSIEKLR